MDFLPGTQADQIESRGVDRSALCRIRKNQERVFPEPILLYLYGTKGKPLAPCRCIGEIQPRQRDGLGFSQQSLENGVRHCPYVSGYENKGHERNEALRFVPEKSVQLIFKNGIVKEFFDRFAAVCRTFTAGRRRCSLGHPALPLWLCDRLSKKQVL